MAVFDVLMVDPPWPLRLAGQRLRKGHPAQPRRLDYDTMTLPRLFALLHDDILSQGAPSHVVFLWTTEGMLHDAEEAMAAMGYHRHIRLIWDKGNGPAPAFTVRWSHEYLVWFFRGGLLPVAPAMRGKHLSVFHASPREHSRKPEAAYRLIEDLYPTATRLDAFSRQRRPGWTAWGDQLDHFPPAPTPLFAAAH